MFLLTGCSNTIENKIQAEKPKELKVTLESNPKKLHVNEKVTITSTVKYGNEDISKDADVTFEVIENGVSYGDVPVDPSANGNYQLELKFSEPGKQKVIAHVTYQGFHEMPSLPLKVTE